MINMILASASPRRKELLEQIGISFEIIPSRCEEKITCTHPKDVVLELSEQKAEDIWNRIGREGEFCILGADTIVAFGSEIMGKPHSEEEAYRMLKKLQGNTHQVYTGVTMIYCRDGEGCRKSFYEETKVTMYSMSEEEIWEYIRTKEPMDKAGAYGIQGRCAAYIKEISGDYNNVVGLPVGRVYQELKEYGADAIINTPIELMKYIGKEA